VESGKWRVESEEWRVESEEWRVVCIVFASKKYKIVLV
jgi:hypothetical protein